MKLSDMKKQNRRGFLSDTVKTAVGTSLAMGFPHLLCRLRCLEKYPSNRINIGAIGTGRISRVMICRCLAIRLCPDLRRL